MKIKTEDALGCTLVEDVFSENGNLILPEGVTLSAGLVSALLKQGIVSINVTSISGSEKNTHETGATSDPKVDSSDSQFSKYVDKLFLKHKGKHMKEFKQCLLKKSNAS